MTLRKILRTLVCSLAISGSLLAGNFAFAQSAQPPLPVFTPDAAEVRRAEAQARQGDTNAMALLGMTYLSGDGSILPKDPAKGVQWLRRSAELGNAPAQFALAGLYDMGSGVQKDHQEATRWYRKAADAGLPGLPALYWLLSLNLIEGYGSEREPGEAVRLATRTAEEADPVAATLAMYRLGNAYLSGVRAPLDPAEGMRWHRKAAGQGDVYSMEVLGWRYLKGMDVPRNETVGVQWLRFAAERGHVRAMRSLAAILMEGCGKVRPDREEAAKWLRLAAAQGDESATASFKQIAP